MHAWGSVTARAFKNLKIQKFAKCRANIAGNVRTEVLFLEKEFWRIFVDLDYWRKSATARWRCKLKEIKASRYICIYWL
jgi:hypothetical protein